MSNIEELESKLDQNFVAIRYNVEIEGPAIKPENDSDVQNILPKEEPYKSIALAVLYGDMEASLTLMMAWRQDYPPLT